MFVFSTRASLDFVFRPFKAEDTDTVDVMLVGTKDGNIHLSIYDSFVIGNFRPGPPDNAAALEGLELCCHASTPDISTHSLLLKPQGDRRDAVYLLPIDLTFVHSSPVNLSLLASKTTTLQNLLRYIMQTQVHMVGEWKSTRELPGRFLAGVQEDLEKMPNGSVSIVQALYHTLVTGHVFPPVREWLVDRLAERVRERLDMHNLLFVSLANSEAGTQAVG
jgi:anaphase-promoting complex subunit 4